VRIGWGELLKRTAKEFNEDNCLGVSAQLAYYFFLALFPAVLFLVALASFFPLRNLMEQILEPLGAFAPADVLDIVRQQIEKISEGYNGGLLTVGVLGALWSSSAALVAIVDALNRAYDLVESRPWWKVRLVAILLTIGLAVFILVSFMLVLLGPTLAETMAAWFRLGPVFEWMWNIAQWPLVLFLVMTAFGIIYYAAPDANHEWVWVTPGALLGAILWLVTSLAFKVYVANFGNYTGTYGAIGGVIVFLLWFYLSGVAILVGAELNSEIEHAAEPVNAPARQVSGGEAATLAAREAQQKTASSPRGRATGATVGAGLPRRSRGRVATSTARAVAVLALALIIGFVRKRSPFHSGI